jgi:hypothetical protein
MKKLSKEEFFLDMNMTLFNDNGRPTIQFRKNISLCDKNKEFFKKIIQESFNDNLVTVPVIIQFADKTKAFNKLKELGLIEGNYRIKVGLSPE